MTRLRYNPTPLTLEVRAGFADAYGDPWNARKAWDDWFAGEEARIRADERKHQAEQLEWLSDETWALVGEERAFGLLDAAKLLREYD